MGLGISVSFPNGEQAICRAALLCAVLDLPARAIVTNFVQYNGYWGCGHCLQKGKTISIITVIIFVIIINRS